MKHAVTVLREEKRRLLESLSDVQNALEISATDEEARSLEREIVREVNEIAQAIPILCRIGHLPVSGEDGETAERLPIFRPSAHTQPA